MVKIISDYRNNHHELIVQNSGNLQQQNEVSDGFGITSTRNRLKLLFGGKASFDIKDNGEHLVEAIIIMPVQSNLLV